MTGTPSFNLVNDPWLRAVDGDGRLVELSLVEVFEQAPRLARIVGEVPTQAFAVLRLLLAITHRASGGPQSVEQWRHMWGSWDVVVEWVRAYLQAHRDRFDLRDPERPFFQVADLRAASDAVSGLEKLIADVPNGNPYFTTRIGRGLERIDWAEAARWLVHVQAYDPSGIRTGAVGDPRARGGKGYPIGTGWTGQLGGVHLVGDTLAETILLNLVVPGAVDLASGPDDLPAWERPPLDQCADASNGGEPRGLVDLYCWQARRVRLIGDDDGVIGVVLAQGDRMSPQNRERWEPMTGWRYSEPQTKKLGQVTYMPRGHDPERAFWRGLPSLLGQSVPSSAVTGPPRWRPPGVLTWVSLLRHDGALDESLVRLHAIGVEYGPQQSTFAEIIDDELVTPLAVLTDPTLARVAVDAVTVADLAVRQIGDLARNVAEAAGASTEDEGPRERAREVAFAALDVPYRRWLSGLAGLDDAGVRAAEVAWQVAVHDLLTELKHDVVGSAAPAAWVGRVVAKRHLDVGLAERWFLAGLRAALPLVAASSVATPAGQAAPVPTEESA